MKPAKGALQVSEITTEAVTERFSRRLRAMIGPGRRWTFGGVAELTDIDERSLRAYAAGTACPNLAKYKRLLSVLGPEVAAFEEEFAAYCQTRHAIEDAMPSAKEGDQQLLDDLVLANDDARQLPFDFIKAVAKLADWPAG